MYDHKAMYYSKAICTTIKLCNTTVKLCIAIKLRVYYHKDTFLYINFSYASLVISTKFVLQSLSRRMY